jgi:hypothetical protein
MELRPDKIHLPADELSSEVRPAGLFYAHRDHVDLGILLL